MEIIFLKAYIKPQNKISDMKNTLDGINSKWKEENINEIEDIILETIQNETCKYKKTEKDPQKEQGINELWDNSHQISINNRSLQRTGKSKLLAKAIQRKN